MSLKWTLFIREETMDLLRRLAVVRGVSVEEALHEAVESHAMVSGVVLEDSEEEYSEG